MNWTRKSIPNPDRGLLPEEHKQRAAARRRGSRFVKMSMMTITLRLSTPIVHLIREVTEAIVARKPVMVLAVMVLVVLIRAAGQPLVARIPGLTALDLEMYSRTLSDLFE